MNKPDNINGKKDKFLKKNILTSIIKLFEENESISSSDLIELFVKFENDDLIEKESFWFSKYNHNCGLSGEFYLTEKLSYDGYRTMIIFNYYIYNNNFSFIQFTKIYESLSLNETILIKRDFMYKDFKKSVDLL